jgi:hypothetical protein
MTVFHSEFRPRCGEIWIEKIDSICFTTICKAPSAIRRPLAEALENVSTCQKRRSEDKRSNIGGGKLRSYLVPPGAVGGMYGSGCFHVCSIRSVSSTSAWTPSAMRCAEPPRSATDPLRLEVFDILLRVKEPPDVQCLPSPHVSVNGPVQRHLQCPAVKGPVRGSSGGKRRFVGEPTSPAADGS